MKYSSLASVYSFLQFDCLFFLELDICTFTKGEEKFISYQLTGADHWAPSIFLCLSWSYLNIRLVLRTLFNGVLERAFTASNATSNLKVRLWGRTLPERKTYKKLIIYPYYLPCCCLTWLFFTFYNTAQERPGQCQKYNTMHLLHSLRAFLYLRN